MSFAKRLLLLVPGLILIAAAVACGGGSSTTPPANTYTISGTVTRLICASGAACKVPVADATVALGGAKTATTTTDAAGAFAFTGLADATYTVSPALDGYLFTPSAPSVVVSGAGKTQDFTAASAIPAYAVSGTISYAGAKPGRVYLTAYPIGCGNCQGIAGTSVAAPGPYTIQGVVPGSYVVTARRDVLGKGAWNASDPSGSTAATVTVGSANVGGADITLADPTTPAPSALLAPNLIPGKNGMLVFWDTDRNVSGTEKATSYDVSWGTTAAADTSVINLPAMDDGSFLQGGLTDGTPHYYKVRSNVGGVSAGWSPVASATPGPAAGNYSVSGTVAYTGAASGPLFIAVGDPNSGNMQVSAYPAPASSPAAFTVTGVPAGTWAVYAILDQNDNHVIDAGDLKNVNDANATMVTVSGNTTGVAVALSSAKGNASTATQHEKSSGGVSSYGLRNTLGDGVQRAVKVTVLSGKNVPVPVDLARQRDHEVQVGLGATVPGVGDTYRYQVTYADGTTEILTSSVTRVLNTFATGLTATTTGGGSVDQPLFSWTAPSPAPTGTWGYTVGLWGGAGANWYFPRDAWMTANTLTSIRYNADGNASPPNLTAGSYTWSVAVVDTGGNQARQQKDYVVP